MAKEYIEREAAVKYLTEVYDGFSAMTPTYYNGYMNAVYQVKHTVPAADVVEVVRCKDCKFFGREISHGKHECKQYEMPYCMENDFCSYGERRYNNAAD